MEKLKAEEVQEEYILVTHKPEEESLRTWTDRTGSLALQAEFVGFSYSGKICLHEANGARIQVAATKLSLADLAYIASRANVGLERDDPRFSGGFRAPFCIPTSLTRPVRTWTDRSHSFTVEASYSGVQDGKLRLRKLNRESIAVPLSNVSLEDLDYVRSTYGVQIEEE